jgi:hypothetical protein
LSDGSLGWHVRYPRSDDCQAAAIATVLQVPIEQVPDPHIDDRLAAGESPEAIDRSAVKELGRWLSGRGLQMRVHASIPPSQRWVGVVGIPGPFQSHNLVMLGRAVLFDPAIVPEIFDDNPGMAPRQWTLDDLTYAITFEPA